MKCYYLGDKKITEAEAKEIEAKNREILRDGTVEELLQIRHVICREEFVCTGHECSCPVLKEKHPLGGYSDGFYSVQAAADGAENVPRVC